MAATNLLSRDLADALDIITQRLANEPGLPWMLSGCVAQALQGVVLVETPTRIEIITGAAEVARVVTLLDVVEREPLATRATTGFAPSPRGTYAVQNASQAAIALEVAGDVHAVGPAGELSLSMERIWGLRVMQPIAGVNIALVPLEVEFVSALLRGVEQEAHAIAEHLFVVGTRWERLEEALAQVPALEQPLWELMDQVRPMAKRARGRRVRKQTGWGKQ